MAKKAARSQRIPRREDIPGIAVDLPDIYPDWTEGARALRIRPFYAGADSLPFSCLEATQIRMEPPLKRHGVPFASANEFRLTQECRDKF
jgi:hypothetical protein